MYDATVLGGLQISHDEPLLWWMNKYEEYHGASTQIPMKTEVAWRRDELVVANVTIKCHRTYRVPDQEESSELPPVRQNSLRYTQATRTEVLTQSPIFRVLGPSLSSLLNS